MKSHLGSDSEQECFVFLRLNRFPELKQLSIKKLIKLGFQEKRILDIIPEHHANVGDYVVIPYPLDKPNQIWIYKIKETQVLVHSAFEHTKWLKYEEPPKFKIDLS